MAKDRLLVVPKFSAPIHTLPTFSETLQICQSMVETEMIWFAGEMIFESKLYFESNTCIFKVVQYIYV